MLARIFKNCSVGVANLYNTSLFTDRQGFRIEDMYYNGIVRLKAKIEIKPTAPDEKGKKRYCEHIGSGDKFSIISKKLEQYKKSKPDKQNNL